MAKRFNCFMTEETSRQLTEIASQSKKKKSRIIGELIEKMYQNENNLSQSSTEVVS